MKVGTYVFESEVVKADFKVDEGLVLLQHQANLFTDWLF